MIKQALVLVTCLSGAASAFMLPPSGVWGMTRDSELIVLARVESRTSDPERPGYVNARLRVEEEWKGMAVGTIDVSYNTGSECPAPPTYRTDEAVIAFLQRFDGRWVTTGVWEGARDARDAEELTAIKRAVLLAASLPESRKTEWAVKAFDAPATRQDAALALGGVADPLTWRAALGPTPVMLPKPTLDSLEASFIRNPTHDDTLISSMVLLRPRRTRRLNLAFANAIDQLVTAEKSPVWVPIVISLYEERLQPLLPIARTLTPEEVLDGWSRRRSPETIERARRRWRELRP